MGSTMIYAPRRCMVIISVFAAMISITLCATFEHIVPETELTTIATAAEKEEDFKSWWASMSAAGSTDRAAEVIVSKATPPKAMPPKAQWAGSELIEEIEGEHKGLLFKKKPNTLLHNKYERAMERFQALRATQKQKVQPHPVEKTKVKKDFGFIKKKVVMATPKKKPPVPVPMSKILSKPKVLKKSVKSNASEQKKKKVQVQKKKQAWITARLSSVLSNLKAEKASEGHQELTQDSSPKSRDMLTEIEKNEIAVASSLHGIKFKKAKAKTAKAESAEKGFSKLTTRHEVEAALLMRQSLLSAQRANVQGLHDSSRTSLKVRKAQQAKEKASKARDTAEMAAKAKAKEIATLQEYHIIDEVPSKKKTLVRKVVHTPKPKPKKK